jgi:outer membrane protein OmpA-like peptidoglycan-associated protein
MRDNLDETYSWPGGDTVRFRGFTLTFGEGTIPLNSDRVIASIGRTLNGRGDDRGGIGTAGSGTLGTSGGGNRTGGNESRNGSSGTAGTSGGGIVSNTGGSTTANGAGIPPGTTGIGNSANIDLEVVPEGIKLTIKDIRFAPDSDQFLPDEYPRLDQIALALREAPDRTFLVEGHTAATGRAQGEMELSIQRAKRMVDELVKRGISADRFLYKGWGGTKPLGDNSTEPGRALNRRVEITILE